jgi:hypothetical protein
MVLSRLAQTLPSWQHQSGPAGQRARLIYILMDGLRPRFCDWAIKRIGSSDSCGSIARQKEAVADHDAASASSPA